MLLRLLFIPLHRLRAAAARAASRWEGEMGAPPRQPNRRREAPPVRWAQVAPPMYIERAAAAAVRHNIEMALSRTASAALATAGRHLFEGGGGGIGVKAAPPERCMPSLSALFSPVASAGIVSAC